jgi:hypothetical protein
VDLSDLYDTLIFFRGDGNGEGSHEELARKIAKAGRQWSLTFWRKEDLNAYFFRCVLFPFERASALTASYQVDIRVRTPHECRQSCYVVYPKYMMVVQDEWLKMSGLGKSGSRLKF